MNYGVAHLFMDHRVHANVVVDWLDHFFVNDWLNVLVVHHWLEDVLVNAWVHVVLVEYWVHDFFVNVGLNVLLVYYGLLVVVMDYWLDVNIVDWLVAVGHAIVVLGHVDVVLWVVDNLLVVVWASDFVNVVHGRMADLFVVVGFVTVLVVHWGVDVVVLAVVVAVMSVVSVVLAMMHRHVVTVATAMLGLKLTSFFGHFFASFFHLHTSWVFLRGFCGHLSIIFNRHRLDALP